MFDSTLQLLLFVLQAVQLLIFILADVDVVIGSHGYESGGDSVKERRHPDALFFVDEHYPVSEMWTEMGKLLFFHFLVWELYSAKGLYVFSL